MVSNPTLPMSDQSELQIHIPCQNRGRSELGPALRAGRLGVAGAGRERSTPHPTRAGAIALRKTYMWNRCVVHLKLILAKL